MSCRSPLPAKLSPWNACAAGNGYTQQDARDGHVQAGVNEDRQANLFPATCNWPLEVDR
jgi:hypothetical protein